MFIKCPLQEAEIKMLKAKIEMLEKQTEYYQKKWEKQNETR